MTKQSPSIPENESAQYLNRLTPFQEQWLAALESGGYEQCTSKLCRVSTYAEGDKTLSYCCLGVGSKMLGLEETDPQPDDNGGSYIGFLDSEKYERAIESGNPSLMNDIFEYAGAPKDVRDKLHLRTEMGRLACNVIEINPGDRPANGGHPQYIIIPRDVGFSSEGMPTINHSTLAELNDRGWTFKQIAAFIRLHPWAAFDNFETPSWAKTR